MQNRSKTALFDGKICTQGSNRQSYEIFAQGHGPPAPPPTATPMSLTLVPECFFLCFLYVWESSISADYILRVSFCRSLRRKSNCLHHFFKPPQYINVFLSFEYLAE